MAIPLTNASLVAALGDVEQGTAGTINNRYLKRRVYLTPTYGSTIAMSEVMGSVACVQDEGSAGFPAVYKKNKSYKKTYNKYSGSTVYEHSIDPESGGDIRMHFAGVANKGDMGLQGLHIGILPPSGTCRVTFEVYGKSTYGSPEIEVVGSKTGNLEGGNKYYLVKGPLSNGSHSFDFNIDSQYPYLTFTTQLILYNQSSNRSAQGNFRNVKAFLI